MVHVTSPFGAQKWEVGTKEETHIRRSLTLKAKISLAIASILTVLVITVIVVCLVVLPKLSKKSWMPEYESISKLGKYKSAAVSTDAAPCAIIGKDILAQEGSAVDAAIAVLLCMGAINPQSLGLGGGFLMVYYDRKDETAYYLDAREVAPENAHENMFAGNGTLSQFGGLAIAVPGELAGYYAAHKRFGRLPWEVLFPPTIKICREGIKVNAHLARALKRYEREIKMFETIRKVMINNETGEVWQQDDVYKRNDLAATLEVIARDKMEALYGDKPTAKQFLKDLEAANSIIQESDMRKYTPEWREPTRKVLRNNVTLYSSSVPGSGALLGFILGILDGYKDINRQVTETESSTIKTLHRIIESFKFAYARRMELEDGDKVEMEKLEMELLSEENAEEIRKKIDDTKTFNDVSHYGLNVTIKEDHGTAHVSVVAPNGDAVSVTSTVNLYFGSMVMSPSTGILLNNEMDDFSLPNVTNYFEIPPSPKNHIRPFKRPFSSMCPAILVDGKGDVLLAVGGNGGTQITTSVAQTVIRNLWLEQDIKKSIDAPRFHHQLLPNHIEYEELFDKDLLNTLKGMGHNLYALGRGMLGIIIGVARGSDGYWYANSDYRKGGEVEGF